MNQLSSITLSAYGISQSIYPEQVPVIEDIDQILQDLQNLGSPPTLEALRKLCTDIQQLTSDCATLEKSPYDYDKDLATQIMQYFNTPFGQYSLASAAAAYSISDPDNVEAMQAAIENLESAGSSFATLISFLQTLQTEYPLPPRS